jgi:hypothetical protein
VSAELERPPGAETVLPSANGGLDPSPPDTFPRTLAELPLGARLVLRCRKDWRLAAVALIELDQITLTVCSPSGHTYRVRRPPDAPLAFDGHIPILTDREHACWRAALARYDMRW